MEGYTLLMATLKRDCILRTNRPTDTGGLLHRSTVQRTRLPFTWTAIPSRSLSFAERVAALLDDRQPVTDR
ncbi:hypothetical protein DPM13_00865 [Paracoccus mutanolyticus]|uniref:Uncharacterized protein n=1 Tax=Paracoccus mutanolyticus TaxID=1499308 RepID=A0ABN5M957_9RHOB|nr:hypothetical protein DPM13_00865 [Paracoccus mutanolyticus]